MADSAAGGANEHATEHAASGKSVAKAFLLKELLKPEDYAPTVHADNGGEIGKGAAQIRIVDGPVILHQCVDVKPPPANIEEFLLRIATKLRGHNVPYEHKTTFAFIGDMAAHLPPEKQPELQRRKNDRARRKETERARVLNECKTAGIEPPPETTPAISDDGMTQFDVNGVFYDDRKRFDAMLRAHLLRLARILIEDGTNSINRVLIAGFYDNHVLDMRRPSDQARERALLQDAGVTDPLMLEDILFSVADRPHLFHSIGEAEIMAFRLAADLVDEADPAGPEVHVHIETVDSDALFCAAIACEHLLYVLGHKHRMFLDFGNVVVDLEKFFNSLHRMHVLEHPSSELSMVVVVQLIGIASCAGGSDFIQKVQGVTPATFVKAMFQYMPVNTSTLDFSTTGTWSYDDMVLLLCMVVEYRRHVNVRKTHSQFMAVYEARATRTQYARLLFAEQTSLKFGLDFKEKDLIDGKAPAISTRTTQVEWTIDYMLRNMFGDRFACV